MTIQTNTTRLSDNTLGELRRATADLPDSTPVTLAIVGYVGEDNPHHDGTGHDEFRTRCRKVQVVTNSVGTTVRLS